MLQRYRAVWLEEAMVVKGHQLPILGLGQKRRMALSL